MISPQPVSLSIGHNGPESLLFILAKTQVLQIVKLALGPPVITRISVTAFADLNRFHQGHPIGMGHKLALLHPQDSYLDDKLLSYSCGGSTPVAGGGLHDESHRAFRLTSQTCSTLCWRFLQCKAGSGLFVYISHEEEMSLNLSVFGCCSQKYPIPPHTHSADFISLLI